MTERNGIIDTAREYSYAENYVIVADGIGHRRLYTSIADITRGRAENRFTSQTVLLSR